MAHYAVIDERSKVISVFVGVNEDVTQLDNGVEVGGSGEAWEAFYTAQFNNPNLTVKRTSYNGNYRGVYAGIGYTYDAVNDVFVAPPAPEVEAES